MPARHRAPEAEPKPILVIMHGEHSCPGRVGQALRRRGHRLEARKPRFGCELPRTLADYSGVVIFGGPMSCNDGDDYIKQEIDFIGVALKEEKPFLGVCLGAQMLAKHLGAKVDSHADQNVEIGYYPLTPTSEGRRIGAWPNRVYHWHREGFQLPTGARLLATGDTFENQAFVYGKAAVGVQFHPEITYSLVNRWTVLAGDWERQKGAQCRSAQLDGHMLHATAVHGWLESMLGHWLAATVAA